MSSQANEPSLSGRTKSQIEADLGASRERLAASVAGLIDEVHPTRIKQRTVGRVRAEVQARLDDVRAYFFNSRGDLRTDHVLSVSGVAAGTLTAVLALRALLRRARR